MAVELKSSTKAEWREQRRACVTATEVAKLAQSWAAYKDIAKEKNGETTFTGNKYTEWGTIREPEIAFEIRQLFPTADPNDQLFSHDKNARHAATPDMIGYKDGAPTYVVEIKTIGERTFERQTEWPSRQYMLQMQWQMYVMDVDHCVFAWELRKEDESGSFYADEPPQVEIVPRDDELIADLVKVADRFIDEYFFGETVELPAINYLLSELRGLEEAKKEIEGRIVELRDQVSEKLSSEPNSYDYGYCTVTRTKPRVTRSFDSKRFQKDHPDMATEYMSEKTGKPGLTIKFN